MKAKTLNLFLGLELFAAVWAGFVFSVIENRLIAGALAGGYFVISGLFMLSRAWSWSEKWRSFFWYPLLVHVFGISIPMVTVRFIQWSRGFEQIQILGLPAPVFHKLANYVFVLLLLGTFIDRVRIARAAR